MTVLAKKVSVVLDRGIYRLRWTANGKRYSLSSGISANHQDKQQLSYLIQIIERDLRLGIFQPPAYYREIINPRKSLSLVEIFQKFANTRVLQESTKKIIYGTIIKILNKCPLTLKNANELPTWLENAGYAPTTIYRVVTRCQASLNWAANQGLIPSNPLAGIKVPKIRKKKEINPFSLSECSLILAEARKNPDYYFLIKFLLLTGCRPSEALALEWNDIDENIITFNKSLVAGVIKKKLKTQLYRKFPINPELANLLKEIPRNPCQTRLFEIKWDRFRYFWKRLLKSLGIPYRSPYNLRHSFISEAIARGLSPTSVARIVGNSPKIIFAHYLGGGGDLLVPIFFD